MKLLVGCIILICVLEAVWTKSIVKRDCCSSCTQPCSSGCNAPCNSNQGCSSCCSGGSSCSSPCTRGCNSGCTTAPCNNNQGCSSCTEPRDNTPVLVPFPQSSPELPASAPTTTIVNNTNIGNSSLELTFTNTINTVNNISIPIAINSSNENVVTMHIESIPDGQTAAVNPIVIPQPQPVQPTTVVVRPVLRPNISVIQRVPVAYPVFVPRFMPVPQPYPIPQPIPIPQPFPIPQTPIYTTPCEQRSALLSTLIPGYSSTSSCGQTAGQAIPSAYTSYPSPATGLFQSSQTYPSNLLTLPNQLQYSQFSDAQTLPITQYNNLPYTSGNTEILQPSTAQYQSSEAQNLLLPAGYNQISQQYQSSDVQNLLSTQFPSSLTTGNSQIVQPGLTNTYNALYQPQFSENLLLPSQFSTNNNGTLPTNIGYPFNVNTQPLQQYDGSFLLPQQYTNYAPYQLYGAGNSFLPYGSYPTGIQAPYYQTSSQNTKKEETVEDAKDVEQN